MFCLTNIKKKHKKCCIGLEHISDQDNELIVWKSDGVI